MGLVCVSSKVFRLRLGPQGEAVLIGGRLLRGGA